MTRVSTEPALGALGEAQDSALLTLRGRLAEAAADRGVLDVAYRTIDSPVGTLLIAATDRGVVRLAFAVQNHDAVLDRLAADVSPRILASPARRDLDAVAGQLDEYFAGVRQDFTVTLDLRLARGFRRSVLDHLPEIGYGHTASYATVAGLAGSPRAVRAVGTACAMNPLPLLLPCHRVVRSDGAPGNYAGGAEAKRMLLELESHPPSPGRSLRSSGVLD